MTCFEPVTMRAGPSQAGVRAYLAENDMIGWRARAVDSEGFSEILVRGGGGQFGVQPPLPGRPRKDASTLRPTAKDWGHDGCSSAV